jgi:DNA-binding beta-propeller fold protein YncE
VNIVSRIFCFVAFLFLALLLVGISSCTLMPQPPLHKSTVWILDNADPDRVTVIKSDGTPINTITGIDIDQTIGGNRRLAVSPDGSYALVSVIGPSSQKLVCFEVSGKERWRLERAVAAADFLDPYNAYALTTTGTIYGQAILRIDPRDGRVLEEADQGGFDLVVDREHGAIWIVGADIKKLNLAMDRELLLDPIGWSAVSVDFTSDGSVWVAERAHPDVPGSANRLLKISPDGNVVQRVPLDFSPFCVRVDRTENSLWVAGGGKIHKFRSDGTILVSIAGPSFTLCIDQVDGSVWATGLAGQVAHYAGTGGKLLTVSGFSSDQAWIDSH